MSKITTIGLDIAKNSVTAPRFDEFGKTVLEKGTEAPAGFGLLRQA